MSWLTAYYLTLALMFTATIGLFIWLAWLRRQSPRLHRNRTGRTMTQPADIAKVMEREAER